MPPGKFDMPTVLVTGGFGFVGGRVAVHLAQAGYQVILGSRNAVTPPEWLPQAKVVQMLWDDVATLEKCCTGVDIVIHAAGMNAQDCVADPVAALAFNGVATARLVRVAHYAGVKRFIYLSTAHVYASPLIGTITEEHCPRNLHPYATSHLAGEQAILREGERGGIIPLVLRLSNVIGAPTYKDVNCWMLLANDLSRQAVEQKKLILHSNGNQRRDFVTMTEICQTITQLIEIDHKALTSNIFNAGSGVSTSLLDITSIIQKSCDEVLGYKPEIVMQAKQHSVPLLTYQTEQLENHGIKINQNLTNEINNMLLFCKREFGSH